MSQIKQVIVVRKDLKMRKGKSVSQGSHSSQKVFLDRCTKETTSDTLDGRKIKKYTFEFVEGSEWDVWLNGIFTKIVVSCDSEEELDELYQKAKLRHLPCSMIVDAGLTEFNGVPTKTCIAIGPAKAEDIDPITKNLKLL